MNRGLLTLSRSTYTQHRVFLIFAVIFLGALITLGTVYIQRTPALSADAFIAAARGPFLAFEFSNIPDVERKGSAQSVPVLTYHRIVSDTSDVSNVTYSRFKDQMASLKRSGWDTITLEEFENFIAGKGTVPDKSFLLTFDDGAKESFYPVDPVLEALGYEAVNFIIVESANTPHSTYYLNPREIKRMLKNGRWSIGSHSYDGHRPYPTDASGKTGIFFADRLWLQDKGRLELSAEFIDRVESDLTRAKNTLEETYDVPIQSFAFPLGNETGINGANNFPEGSRLTEERAEHLYSFGHLQLNNQQFTANFPRTGISTHLTGNFRIYRVHVDYDWDGERVVEILENSQPKNLPYEDDFSSDHGWVPAWGSLEMGRNNLRIAASSDGTSASTFLDGSALWDNYSFDAALAWESGHVILLADLVNSSTYHSCVFSSGMVRIQETVAGKTITLAEKKNESIGYGQNVRPGIRVRGAVIECAWDFQSVAEVYTREARGGGIGLQVWDSQIGSAALQISSLIVRPINTPDS